MHDLTWDTRLTQPFMQKWEEPEAPPHTTILHKSISSVFGNSSNAIIITYFDIELRLTSVQ